MIGTTAKKWSVLNETVEPELPVVVPAGTVEPEPAEPTAEGDDGDDGEDAAE